MLGERCDASMSSQSWRKPNIRSSNVCIVICVYLGECKDSTAPRCGKAIRITEMWWYIHMYILTHGAVLRIEIVDIFTGLTVVSTGYSIRLNDDCWTVFQAFAPVLIGLYLYVFRWCNEVPRRKYQTRRWKNLSLVLESPDYNQSCPNIIKFYKVDTENTQILDGSWLLWTCFDKNWTKQLCICFKLVGK